LKHFTDEQLINQIDAVIEEEEAEVELGIAVGE
jgi:hypothetical protein